MFRWFFDPEGEKARREENKQRYHWSEDRKSARLFNRNTNRWETVRGDDIGEVNKEIEYFNYKQYGHVVDEPEGQGCTVKPGPDTARIAKGMRDYANKVTDPAKKQYWANSAKTWERYAKYGKQ